MSVLGTSEASMLRVHIRPSTLLSRTIGSLRGPAAETITLRGGEGGVDGAMGMNPNQRNST
jgi:hypothetical protein